MAYITQQYAQQFCPPKEKSSNERPCLMQSNLSFLPYFRVPLNRFNKINGGTDLGNLANHASWNGKTTITCGGVASGTKIRIIRICGVKSVATPPNKIT